ENRVVESIAAGANAVPHDMSPWGLFLQADPIVKGGMLLLILASIWCWAIIIEKVRRLRRLTAQADAFEASFWSGGPRDDLYEEVGKRPQDPMSAVFAAGMREWRRSTGRIGLTDTRPGLH